MVTVLVVGATSWLLQRDKRPYAFRPYVFSENRLPLVSSEQDPDLRRLGDAVGELLANGDAKAFAEAVTATTEDWAAILPKSAGADFEHPLGDENERDEHLRLTRAYVTGSVAYLLELAHRNGAGLGRVRFKVAAVTARAVGENLHQVTPQDTVRVPHLRSVRIQLVAKPVDGPGADASAARWTGGCELLIGNVEHFPSGWKIEDGLRWTRLPAAAIDAATSQELALLAKVALDYRERKDLTAADDPALIEFGDALITFLHQRSAPDFARRATMAPDELRAFHGKLQWTKPEDWGRSFPQMLGKVESSAHALLALLDRLGVDLSDATIRVKAVDAERVGFGTAQFGSLNGLRASLLVTLEVQSPRKAANGGSISGDYGIEVRSPMRWEGRWVALDEHTRWRTLPATIMTRAVRDELELQNHVQKEHALPVGMIAPEIAFTRLADGAPGKLADHRGKVVVLEFWASWCGPCQEPMTKLQELLAKHPEWRNRAEVLTISVDDTLEQARTHVAKRGWTTTTHIWAGEGAFKSAAALPFRLQGVPTLYIIDPKGKIVAAGHPLEVKVADLVAKHLP